MDWAGEDRARLLAWLEEANGGRYVGERRLDPFATSMRDFDDVSADLQRLRDRLEPARNDPGQRIVDLRAAGLAHTSHVGLSPLGERTLMGWERHGVANVDKNNELARHLIVAAEASKANAPPYVSFFEYWSELRIRYASDELIDNWDALFTLNYLDFPRNGYCPGSRFGEGTGSVTDIQSLLDGVTEREANSSPAVAGAKRIGSAIGHRIPRGRHRATFCSALEIVAGGKSSMDHVIDHFGIPKGPRDWSPLDQLRRGTIGEIAQQYGLLGLPTAGIEGEVIWPEVKGHEDLVHVQRDTDDHDNFPGEAGDGQTLGLPDDIQFEYVLVDLPRKTTEWRFSKRRPISSLNRKIDHIKKAIQNQQVGNLGERFGFRFEHWRLRDRPDLQRKIRHISTIDDSAGYDILSFETNGTSRFVEVKGTLGALETPFFITAREAEIAEEKGDEYVILRVFNLAESPKCCEIYFPFEGVIELSPSSFVANFV